jgi:hypothetical protein
VDGAVTRHRSLLRADDLAQLSPEGLAAAIIEAVRCPQDAVYNMLDYLDRAGGAAAYLAGIGLTGAEIARLRGRLR